MQEQNQANLSLASTQPQKIVSDDWKPKIQDLQKLLKQEYSLLWTQNQQKNLFEKKLSDIILLYHRNKIHSMSTISNQLQKKANPKIQKVDSINPFENKKALSKVKSNSSWETPDASSSERSILNDKHFSSDKILLEDEGFGDSCFYIKQVLLTLSKDPELMLTIIRKHQTWSNAEPFQNIAKPIIDSFYENILDDDIHNKPYFVILQECFKLIVQPTKHFYDIKLEKDSSFAGLIVKEFLKKAQIKNYAKQVIRNTMLEIGKIDHQIKWQAIQDTKNSYKDSQSSFSSIMNKGKSDKESKGRNSNSISLGDNFGLSTLRLSKVDSKRFQSPTKDYKMFPKSKNIHSNSSKIAQYSEALKAKDQKIKAIVQSQSPTKKSSGSSSKNRKCISNELLEYLGISQQIHFPTFISSSANNEVKKQEQINKQWAAMLSHRESIIETNQDIYQIKNIVLIFFSDLFRMLYSLPLNLRLACKKLYNVLEKKFNSKKASFYVLSNYFLELVIVQQINIQETLNDQFDKMGSNGASFNSNNLKANIQSVRNIISSIIRNDYNSVPKSFEYQFNLIIGNLRISLFNYLGELINIDIFDEGQKSIRKCSETSVQQIKMKNIKSYAICISIADIKGIFEMIKLCKSELKQINNNQKLIKRIERIEMVSDGKDIYLERLDRSTGISYKPEHAFVMFYELELPQELSVDYLKYHQSFFKKQKMKKLFKLLLLGIKDVQLYLEFHQSNSLFEFILKLTQKDYSIDTSTQVERIDHISTDIKAKYLVSLVKNNFEKDQYASALDEQISKMHTETKERMIYYKSIWDKSKQCYLKALSSVIYLNQTLQSNQAINRKQLKSKKLDEFMAKTKISICLTSPRTREKEIVLKTNIMKDLTDEQKNKIWVENQNKCIHTALNLEFIKSLTGQPEKIKRHQSHCSSILKFPDIFCGLPEIRASSTQNLGVKQAFFDFINYCIEIAKGKPGYEMLADSIEWMEQNLEQKLSKKIYEKLYPKNPTYEDTAFYIRLKTLDFISYHHLGIDASLRFQKMWELAGKQLRMIDKVKTVGEKLNCINECNKIISNSYHLISQKTQPATSDDIYPILIYVLIKAAPKRMISNMTFIQYLGNQDKLMSKEGYAFSQLKAAIQYCDTLNFHQLQTMRGDNNSNLDSTSPEPQNMFKKKVEKPIQPIPSSTACTPSEKYVQFAKTIYEKEIEYGIYFLLLHKKENLQTKNSRLNFLKQFFNKIKDQDEKSEQMKQQTGLIKLIN